MTIVRTSVQLACTALLTFILLYDSAISRHSSFLLLIPLVPLVLIFLVAPTAKAVFSEGLSLCSSFSLWQGIWLLLFFSALVFRMRGPQEIDRSALDTWAIYRIGLVLIAGLILCRRLVNNQTRWLAQLFSGTLGLLAVYPLLSLVSTAWSVRPLWTFYKSVEYLVDLAAISAVVVSVGSVREYRKFANWSWTLLGLLVASAWVGALVDPSDGLLSGQSIGPLTVRLEGVIPSIDANTIGEICAILALVALNRLLNDPQAKSTRGWYRGLFMASVLTLVVSQTRAAMVAFVIGLAVLLFVTRRYALTMILGAVSAIGAVIALSFTNFERTLFDFFLRGESVQSAEGLSGRMDVWQASLAAFLHHPWTGYGGFAGSRFVVLPGIPSQGLASSALSTYVDSLLDLGVWGPLLIGVVLIAAFRFLFEAARQYTGVISDRPLAVEMLVVFSVVAVRSLVTSNIVGHLSLAFLTVIGFIEVVRRETAARRKATLARAA
jgi:hypothetical protein